MRMGRFRRGVVVLGTAVLTSLALPSHAAPPPEYEVVYVAHDFYVVGPDLAAQEAERVTGHRTAPLGWYPVTVVGGEVTVTVDDRGPFDHVPLSVTGTGSAARHLCVRVGEPTAIGGLRDGTTVSLYVSNATYGFSCRPRAGATSGVLRIVP